MSSLVTAESSARAARTMPERAADTHGCSENSRADTDIAAPAHTHTHINAYNDKRLKLRISSEYNSKSEPILYEKCHYFEITLCLFIIQSPITGWVMARSPYV
jgi:hypothetical protein